MRVGWFLYLRTFNKVRIHNNLVANTYGVAAYVTFRKANAREEIVKDSYGLQRIHCRYKLVLPASAKED